MNIKKFFAITGSLMIVAVAFLGVACSSQAATSTGDFRIAAYGYLPPLTYLNNKNQLVGIETDLAKIMAKDMGKKFKADILEWDGVLASVQGGTHDATMTMTPTPARMEQFDFSDVYLSTSLMMIARSSDTRLDSCTTKEQVAAILYGKRIAVPSGSSQYLDYVAGVGATPVNFNNLLLSITSLANSGVDFVIFEFLITDNGPVTDLFKKNTNIKLIEIPLEPSDIACAVKKGNTQLLDKMNATIRAVKADGRLENIIGEHV